MASQKIWFLAGTWTGGVWILDLTTTLSHRGGGIVGQVPSPCLVARRRHGIVQGIIHGLIGGFHAVVSILLFFEIGEVGMTLGRYLWGVNSVLHVTTPNNESSNRTAIVAYQDVKEANRMKDNQLLLLWGVHIDVTAPKVIRERPSAVRALVLCQLLSEHLH